MTSTAFPGYYDTICRSSGYDLTTSGSQTTVTNTSSCTPFQRSSEVDWAKRLLGTTDMLDLAGIGSFYYVRANSSTFNTFEMHGVSFQLSGNVSTSTSATQSQSSRSSLGEVCFPNSENQSYRVSFPDGTKENLSSCISFSSQAGMWELHLSNHASPQAGLLMLNIGIFYYLVTA